MNFQQLSCRGHYLHCSSVEAPRLSLIRESQCQNVALIAFLDDADETPPAQKKSHSVHSSFDSRLIPLAIGIFIQRTESIIAS